MRLKMKKTLSPYSPVSAPKRADSPHRNALSDVLPLFSNVAPKRTNDDAFAPPQNRRSSEKT